MPFWRALPVVWLVAYAWPQKPDLNHYPIHVPKLGRAPAIDGDLGDWKDTAFSDGVWDIERVRHASWFDSKINRLTDHGGEASAAQDLGARYYIAWDDRYLYLGAEVTDNVNDTADPAHEAKRWYYKDAICWFVEAPRLAPAKKFGEADNAFCFVADAHRPDYGAWWRHGSPEKTYIEEALGPRADYALRMTKRGTGDFVLEARVDIVATLGASSPRWRAPREGDVYGLEIVHTDPDGGGYGGHLLIYGRGDDDATWGWMQLTGPATPIERRPQ
ncbi:MAG: sugar-binding protein [Bryobacteraceae bacterium]